MSQCNSRAELHRRMADVYDFCKGTVFEGREQECVKINRRLVDFPLLFAGSPYRYEFALTPDLQRKSNDISDELKLAADTITELQDFVIWMMGCGYDFTQHKYFCEQRDKLLNQCKGT